MKKLTIAARRDRIAIDAWKRWTNDGRGMTVAQCDRSMSVACATAKAVYFRGITDAQWLTDTLARILAGMLQLRTGGLR